MPRAKHTMRRIWRELDLIQIRELTLMRERDQVDRLLIEQGNKRIYWQAERRRLLRAKS